MLRLPRLSSAKLTLSVPNFGLVRAHLVAAARALDLDHFGAGFGEDQRRERAGQQRAEVEDADALRGVACS